jgi:hypothetical protein
MQLAIALRTLWRHKIIVALGLIIAILAGMALAFKLPSLQSRSFNVGVATEEILVDTPSTQIVDVSPAGAYNLGQTANLLSTVMTQGAVREGVIAKAGLVPSRFSAFSLSNNSSGSGPGSAAQTTPPPDSSLLEPGSGVMTTQTLMDSSGNDLPIIWVQTRAATPAKAVAMANAAVSSLDAYVRSSALGNKIPARQTLHVSALGTPQATVASSGTSPMMAAAAAIVIFGLVCLMILGCSAVARGWRQAAALERAEMDDEEDDEDEAELQAGADYPRLASQPPAPPVEGEPHAAAVSSVDEERGLLESVATGWRRGR